MHVRRRGLGAGCALAWTVVLGRSSLARADAATTPLPIELGWSAPADADCPSREEMARSVELVLQRPVFAAEASIILRGAIQRVSGERTVRWRAEISLDTAEGRLGTRLLESESRRCSDFADSLALIIAVAIESLETSPPAPLRVGEPAHYRWSSELGLEGEGMAGLLPGLGFGAGIWATVEPHPDWQLELGAIRFAARSALVGGHGATFDAYAAGIGACRRLTADAVAMLWGCLSFDLAEVRATGEELSVTRSVTSLLPAAGPELAGAFRLGGRWTLRASLGGELPFQRDRFYFGGDSSRTDVHRVGPLLFTAALGFGVRIP